MRTYIDLYWRMLLEM